MAKRNFLIAAVLLPLVFFMAWISSLEIRENFNTQEVQIAVKGYDPRDLLSGHYISLQLDWADTDCQPFFQQSCPLDEFDAVYRFYMPEKSALELDEKIRKQGNQMRMKLVFAYAKGQKPIVQNLLINGENWQEYLNYGR